MTARQTRRPEHVITAIGTITDFGSYVQVMLLSADRPVRIVMTQGVYEDLARQIAMREAVRPTEH